MNKRVREDREVRISQIVDEAIRIVGELGYYGFTVQALAGRCGISNAGLLYYFGSKDGLLLALLDEIERREEEFMAPLISVVEDRHDGGPERQIFAVAAMMRSMAERLAANPEQARFLIMMQAESMEPSHPAHLWFAQREAETINLLVRLLEQVAPAQLPVARYLMALVQGLGQQWIRGGQNFDLAEECEIAVRMLLANPSA